MLFVHKIHTFSSSPQIHSAKANLLGNQIGAFYLQQILDESKTDCSHYILGFFYTMLHKGTGLSWECDYKGLVFNPLQNWSGFAQNQYL